MSAYPAWPAAFIYENPEGTLYSDHIPFDGAERPVQAPSRGGRELRALSLKVT